MKGIDARNPLPRVVAPILFSLEIVGGKGAFTHDGRPGRA
jgi:hypothetical protein